MPVRAFFSGDRDWLISKNRSMQLYVSCKARPLDDGKGFWNDANMFFGEDDIVSLQSAREGQTRQNISTVVCQFHSAACDGDCDNPV